MQLIPLPSETRIHTGYSHKLILTYADLATWTSGTAQAVIPFNGLGLSSNTNPTPFLFGRNGNRVITPFTSSGGAITTLTFSLGDGGSSGKFINALDLKTAGFATAAATTVSAYNVADTIDAVATIVGQTMASLTAGRLELYVSLVDISRLAAVIEPALPS